MNIQLHPVNSTSISHIGYHPDTHTLAIRFKDRTYTYDKVPIYIWQGFQKAESKGTYFREHIREQFKGKRIEQSA